MRYYSNIASASTIANVGGISSGATTLVLSTTNGMPTQFPFTLRLDPDTASEELVEVTSGAGTVGTPYVITRGFDGTSAKSHNVGAPVVHSVSAIDFRQPQEHSSNVTPGAVHGLPASAWKERVFIYKENDQGYNNDATFNDDLELRVPLLANTDYFVQFFGQVTGMGGDVKTVWKVPLGVTGYRACVGPSLASTSPYATEVQTATSAFDTEVRYGLGHLSGYASIQERGLVRVANTAGELVIQHAQNTSHADLTTMRKSSILIVERVS